MRIFPLVILATLLPFSAYSAEDSYIKIQSNGGSRINQLEFDMHYGKDYIALHGAVNLINPPEIGPLTGSCAFQSELVLFCNTNYGISGTLGIRIGFENDAEEEDEDPLPPVRGDIDDITWTSYSPTGSFGGTEHGTIIAYEEYGNVQAEDVYARWQMSGGTGINVGLTVIEMDVEVGRHFLALHGKATRASGVVPLSGTCIREQDGDFYCVTDYADYGDMTMLLRPTNSSAAIMAMRSYGSNGVESGRANGALVELK